MNEGQAGAWASQFLDDCQKNVTPANPALDLGTYTTFRKALQDSFSAYDSKGDAYDTIKNLRMKSSDSIDEHIVHFRMLLSETRITDKDVCIDLFRESLTQPLQTRILMLPQAPATLDQWYKWAAKLDHQWKQMRRILGKTQDNTKAKGGQLKRFFFP